MASWHWYATEYRTVYAHDDIYIERVRAARVSGDRSYDYPVLDEQLTRVIAERGLCHISHVTMNTDGSTFAALLHVVGGWIYVCRGQLAWNDIALEELGRFQCQIYMATGRFDL